MPVLALQSPRRVPDAGAATPVIVIALKSTSTKNTDEQVNVRADVLELDRTNVRQVASKFPDTLKEPLMVWSAENVTFFKPALPGPVIEKPEKMFDPVIARVVPALVLVKKTL
jgi:hypothetical protein